jgi:hypothetical protein
MARPHFTFRARSGHGHFSRLESFALALAVAWVVVAFVVVVRS